MKKIIDKIANYYNKNNVLVLIIFFVIIPILIGVIGGTFAYSDKGFLGALAEFIRYVLFFYGICLFLYMWINIIYEYLTVKWETTLAILINIILLALIFFVIWLLTNY